MRLAHLADTHLGYAGGPPVLVEDPWRPRTLLRHRQVDIMSAFAQAVDRIIDHVRPDVVVHAGDLFDSAQPPPHAVDFAMTQLARLSAEGIPVVIVEGNHSFPRDRARGNVLRIVAHLRGVTVICDDAQQVVIGDVAFDGFPHRALARGRVPDRTALRAGANVLVAHAVADGWHYFKTGRPGADLAVAACAPWYDYVALGHCHRFWQIPETDRAFYSGATAMVTWHDLVPGHRFGFSVVTLGGGVPDVRAELLDGRPMHTYGLDDAGGLTAREVLALLAHQAAGEAPDGANCLVVVEGLDPPVRRELSTREVAEIFGAAAGMDIRLRQRELRWEGVRAGLVEGGDPARRFEELVRVGGGDETFRQDVLSLGRELLDRAHEQLGAEDLAVAGVAGARSEGGEGGDEGDDDDGGSGGDDESD